MKIAKVYIPQLPTRFDYATQQRIPTINVNPASRYGDLVQLSAPGTDHAEGLAQVKAAAQAIGNSDYILAVGDVVLLTWTILTALRQNGRATLLRWDGKDYTTEEIRT